jgi:hypothetical protein
MQDTIGSVKIDLDEDEIRRLTQQRDETKFRELLVRLRKMLGKRS